MSLGFFGSNSDNSYPNPQVVQLKSTFDTGITDTLSLTLDSIPLINSRLIALGMHSNGTSNALDSLTQLGVTWPSAHSPDLDNSNVTMELWVSDLITQNAITTISGVFSSSSADKVLIIMEVKNLNKDSFLGDMTQVNIGTAVNTITTKLLLPSDNIGKLSNKMLSIAGVTWEHGNGYPISSTGTNWITTLSGVSTGATGADRLTDLAYQVVTSGIYSDNTFSHTGTADNVFAVSTLLKGLGSKPRIFPYVTQLASNDGSVSGGGTITATFNTSVVAGNTLIVAISRQETDTAAATAVTGGGGTWSKLNSIDAGTCILDIWIASNISGSGTVITATVGGSTGGTAIIALEVTSCSRLSPNVLVSAGTNTGTSTTLATGTTTPTIGGLAIAIAALNGTGVGPGMTVDNNFNLLKFRTDGTDTLLAVAIKDALPGNITANFTIASSRQYSAGIIVVTK